MEKYTAIKQRADKYIDMLAQVDDFRASWDDELKQRILGKASSVISNTSLEADVREQEEIKGLGAISIKLGTKKSGIYRIEEGSDRRDFFKELGALFYSQLFNGKVQVWMTYPLIEGLMEPRPPKLIGIYAPPEFNEDLILSHFEVFLKELIEWEDYDDDNPDQSEVRKIGFGFNQDAAMQD